METAERMKPDNSFTSVRTGTGTREWSEYSHNIGLGCSHGCLYCYARFNAVRFKKIASPAEWIKERENIIPKMAPLKKQGVFMFPTSHDITPAYYSAALLALKRILNHGNKVLIVTKPHLDIIKKLCLELFRCQKQILFRFTITTLNPDVSLLWEPGAPLPEERITALKHAYHAGYQTSVSAEPLLGNYVTARDIYDAAGKYVTDKIWIGKLNNGSRRIYELNSRPEVKKAYQDILRYQTPEGIKGIKEVLKHAPKIAWKESMRKETNV